MESTIKQGNSGMIFSPYEFIMVQTLMVIRLFKQTFFKILLKANKNQKSDKSTKNITPEIKEKTTVPRSEQNENPTIQPNNANHTIKKEPHFDPSNHKIAFYRARPFSLPASL